MRVSLILYTLLFITAAIAVRAQKEKPDEDMVILASWMSGSFSSEKQSKADTSYLDVRLHMRRMWSESMDGFWILVEQALATSQDRPYQQWVYHVKRVEENMIESSVYRWKDPVAVVGAWNDTTKLDGLGIESIMIERGCEVYMQNDGEGFFGSTHGTACISEIRGASYATSEVKIFNDAVMRWDRGFSTDGSQIGGSTKGGYVFLKQYGW